METIIGIAILAGIAYLIFRVCRGIFRTWKISLPIMFCVVLFGILAAKGIIKVDDYSGALTIACLIGAGVIAWAAYIRCPHCKTFTIRKVCEKREGSSGVFQKKSGDGKYHPHQKVSMVSIYRCSKCGFEKRHNWSKTERLDD